jgi:hypothetical protein
MVNNHEYEILTPFGFKNFDGINKIYKGYIQIKTENGCSVKCSSNHLFVIDDKNILAKDIIINETLLDTLNGKSLVTDVIHFDDKIELYDLINVEGDNIYYTNDIVSHNCSFLGSGNNFIDEQYIQFQEKNNVIDPIRYDYIDRNFWIWEDPLQEHKYLVTIDVSSGRGEDSSCINILKILENGVEQVAEYHGKLPPDVLGELGYHYAVKYNNGHVVIDVTGSYGVPTMQKILEYGYKNVYYSKIKNQEIKSQFEEYLQGEDVPGFTIGTNRGLILLEFERVFRSNEIVVRSSRFTSELKNFLSVDSANRVADHRRSTHDDIIMATAIGLYVLSTNVRLVTETSERSGKLLNAWISSKNLPENQDKYQEMIRQQKRRRGPYDDNAWLFK